MLNCLISHGIVSQSGTINKDKINLVSGVVTPPFAEMAWLSSGGDAETINRLTSILSSMNMKKDRDILFKLVQMLYGLLGLNFPQKAMIMNENPEALEYFLFSFICDFGEIMHEYLVENTRK